MVTSRTSKKVEPPVLNRLAIVLKEERKSNRWLATETGFTETTISQWSMNRKQPTIFNLYLIALLLRRDLKDLLVSTHATDDKTRTDHIKLLKRLAESGKRVKGLKR